MVYNIIPYRNLRKQYYTNARLKKSWRSFSTTMIETTSNKRVCIHLLSGWVEKISLKYPAVIWNTIATRMLRLVL